MYRFGFFCSLSDNKFSTNRTIQLKSLTYEKIEEKVRQNSQELIALLQYCQTKEFPIFRLGNAFIPFLSHKDFDLKWLNKLQPILEETKEKIADFDIRITIHPGQYTVLNSPNKEVVKNALRELKCMFWLFDMLGIDKNGTVLIHGGGAYNDKPKALTSLIQTIKDNDWLTERLALENDEKIFTAQEILEVCNEVEIPMVFDIYHHSLNRSTFNPKDIINTWKERRMKVHLSSKGEGRFGNHADYIEAGIFLALEQMFFEDIYDIDIMVEAKKKELAIEKLKQDIAI